MKTTISILFGLIILLSGISSTAQPTETDTIYHYTTDGRLSVRISPWENSYRHIELFDMHGNNVMTLEEARHSFTVSHHITFYENGTVKEIKSHMNPGASMYMYNSTITFKYFNEPQWKRSERFPMMALDDSAKNFYWDKKEKKWVQQEIAICDPPRNIE